MSAPTWAGVEVEDQRHVGWSLEVTCRLAHVVVGEDDGPGGALGHRRGRYLRLGEAGGTSEVIAVDPIASKEQIARACGAARFVSATGSDQHEAVIEITGGDGAELVIEAVGLPQTFTAAIDLAAFCGRVVYVGYSKAPVTYETKLFNLKELDIFGSRNATRQDFQAVIAALEELGDAADRLVTRHVPLSEADGALPYWADNPQDVLKLVVTL